MDQEKLLGKKHLIPVNDQRAITKLYEDYGMYLLKLVLDGVRKNSGSTLRMMNEGSTIRFVEGSTNSLLFFVFIQDGVMRFSKDHQDLKMRVNSLGGEGICISDCFFKYQWKVKKKWFKPVAFQISADCPDLGELCEIFHKILNDCPRYLGGTIPRRNKHRLAELTEDSFSVPHRMEGKAGKSKPDYLLFIRDLLILYPSMEREEVTVNYLKCVDTSKICREDAKYLNDKHFKVLPKGWLFGRKSYPQSFLVSKKFDISGGLDVQKIEGWVQSVKEVSEKFLGPFYKEASEIEDSVGYFIKIDTEETYFTYNPRYPSSPHEATRAVTKIVRAHKLREPQVEGKHVEYMSVHGGNTCYASISGKDFEIVKVKDGGVICPLG